MPQRSWSAPPLLTWPQTTVVPLINVVLLLLGFLLLSPLFLTPTGVPLHLPKAVTAESIGGAGIVITVTEQRLIYVNDHLTTMEELSAQLIPLLTQGQTVLIKADRQVPIGEMSAIWDLCRRLGASRIAMATTRPSD